MKVEFKTLDRFGKIQPSQLACDQLIDALPIETYRIDSIANNEGVWTQKHLMIISCS